MGKATGKRINLALQGGGAHGAFTWGVLERFLEDDRLEIAGISGTSAGALNGAAFKAGYAENGREGARDKLNWVWSEIGAKNTGEMQSWMQGISPAFISSAVQNSPFYQTLDALSRMSSPYNLGLLYNDPLRPIVDALALECSDSSDGPVLYVCATNVRTGKIRIFSGDEITTDAILASGCLPTLFKAVEIEDPKSGRREAYWDGGYAGNPALFPLYAPSLPRDILIVSINPLYREEIPKKATEIQNRINEISFNASLLRDLRAIHFVHRLLETGGVKQGTMKDVLVHMISDDALMRQLSVATKVMPSPIILSNLKQSGRRAADNFLHSHWDALNTSPTVDLRAMFD